MAWWPHILYLLIGQLTFFIMVYFPPSSLNDADKNQVTPAPPLNSSHGLLLHSKDNPGLRYEALCEQASSPLQPHWFSAVVWLSGFSPDLWFTAPSSCIYLNTTSRPVFPHHASSVMSNSLRPSGLGPARLLCSWNSSGKNIGVGCHFFLQGIFPTQGSNSGLSHCRRILYCLSHQGSPL